MTVVYEADREAFLERVKRARAMQSELFAAGGFDVDDWSRRWHELLGETEPIRLVIGVRYRIQVLGGRPELKHVHFKDQAGTVHGVDIPVAELEYQEIEGVYAGRFTSGPWKGLIELRLDGNAFAPLADLDILRIEERS